MGRWSRRVPGIVLLAAVCVAAAAGTARSEDGHGQDAKPPQSVVKTKDGLHFNVPPDWPVEERNGVVGPIPAEEYMARKFSGMDSRLKTLEQQVAGFDLRLRVLEEAVKEDRQEGGLRSSGQGAR